MTLVRPGTDIEGGEAATTQEGRKPALGAARRESVLRLLRVAFGAALFAVVLVAVARSWADVRSTFGRVGAVDLLLAEVLVVLGLAASVLTWRTILRELGSGVRAVDAAKIYLVGQLGKYLPGSVWALAVQMELATRAGVSRGRGMAASLAAITVNVATGLAVGLVVVPRVVDGGAVLTAAVGLVMAVCLVAVSPPVLSRLLALGLRAMRRPPALHRISWQGLAVAGGWSIASWLCYGLSVWVVAVGVGAPAGESLVLCLSGVALAMTAGFLVFVAPSGLGVREGVLVAALAPVLDPAEALAVALAARLVFTVADLLAATVVAPVRIGSARA